MDLTELLLIAIAVGLAVVMFFAIALRWMPKNDGAGAALTSLHDLQPSDKQNATEIVIDQKAGKRWTEQDSGDSSFDAASAVRKLPDDATDRPGTDPAPAEGPAGRKEP